MPCKDKCVLEMIFPNTNASIACDDECCLDENKRFRELYKKSNPLEMESYIEYSEKEKELSSKYISEQYIDYGDLSHRAESQIKKAFIDGLNHPKSGYYLFEGQYMDEPLKVVIDDLDKERAISKLERRYPDFKWMMVSFIKA